MKPLRVLIIEDRENDALLLLRELTKAGYEPASLRVETRQDLDEALKDDWDIVLSDFALPDFGGVEALDIVLKIKPELPFVIVSGQIGEDAAVSAMKAGAHDYVMKSNLKRLAPAVERELAEAAIRREKKKAEDARMRAEEELRALSRRLVHVQEEERRLIARELHDETGQLLALLKITLHRAAKSKGKASLGLLAESDQIVAELIERV